MLSQVFLFLFSDSSPKSTELNITFLRVDISMDCRESYCAEAKCDQLNFSLIVGMVNINDSVV